MKITITHSAEVPVGDLLELYAELRELKKSDNKHISNLIEGVLTSIVCELNAACEAKEIVYKRDKSVSRFRRLEDEDEAPPF